MNVEPGSIDAAPVTPHRATPRGLAEVAGLFLGHGCMSLGGSLAHPGYLHAEPVEKRRWMDDAHHDDVVALCQFLPGPASSQVVFALGMRAGLLGGLLAPICFTLPSGRVDAAIVARRRWHGGRGAVAAGG